MTLRFFKTGSRWTRTGQLALLAGALAVFARCGGGQTKEKGVTKRPDVVAGEYLAQHVFQDFERPGVRLQVVNSADEVGRQSAQGSAATQATYNYRRIAQRPQEGLWALQMEVSGYRCYLQNLEKSANLQGFDTFSVEALQDMGPGHSGGVTAAAVLVDAQGHVATGDAYPLVTQWEHVSLDLKSAGEGGLDLTHIVRMGLELRSTGEDNWTVETDTWKATTSYKSYVGQRLGVPGTFYVQRNGTRLQIGRVNQFEIVFQQRAGNTLPWMEITQGGSPGRRPIGPVGTGLLLLDQDGLDSLAGSLKQVPFDPLSPGSTPLSPLVLPDAAGKAPALVPWPGPETVWRWEVVWTSALGALVEVKQVAGPYDALGRPAVEGTWRCMVYQTGQMYMAFDWAKVGEGKEGGVAAPVSLALVTEGGEGENGKRKTEDVGGEGGGGGPMRLLKEIYTEDWKNGGAGLPHEFQVGNAVVMVAKIKSQENLWWRAELPAIPPSMGGAKRVFGVGLPVEMRGGGDAGNRNQEAGSRKGIVCEVLANPSGALEEAGMFSAYLSPPRVEMLKGTLERNFPGDVDNDSLVEAYGFQTIRLEKGRASFTILPEGRPLYYPVFLMTVPAEERAAFGGAGKRLIINVDGKQLGGEGGVFPRWPDGSFLVQLPWVLHKDVHVEAEVVDR